MRSVRDFFNKMGGKALKKLIFYIKLNPNLMNSVNIDFSNAEFGLKS
jgi:hypothetical protein